MWGNFVKILHSRSPKINQKYAKYILSCSIPLLKSKARILVDFIKSKYIN